MIQFIGHIMGNCSNGKLFKNRGYTISETHMEDSSRLEYLYIGTGGSICYFANLWTKEFESMAYSIQPSN